MDVSRNRLVNAAIELQDFMVNTKRIGHGDVGGHLMDSSVRVVNDEDVMLTDPNVLDISTKAFGVSETGSLWIVTVFSVDNVK